MIARRFPIVLVDGYLPDVDTGFVVSDNEALGYESGMKSAEFLLTRMADPGRAGEQCFVGPGGLVDGSVPKPVHVATAR